MRILRGWLWGLSVAALAAAPFVVGAAPRAEPAKAAETKPVTPMTVEELAAKIDFYIEEAWTKNKVKPAELTNDSAYIRRLYLDLVGKIPDRFDVDTFLADKRADKRQRLVQKLLQEAPYVAHFTNVWHAQLLPLNNNQQFQGLAPQFELWLQA